MKLSTEEANLFFKLMWALLFYINQKYPVIKELKEPMFKNIPQTEIVSLHEKLFSHPELIDSFAAENPFNFTLKELDIIKSWKNFIKSTFLIMAYMRAYTVFLTVTGEQKVYGVLGLHGNIREIIPPFVPQYVETILMPYRGKIIYCGYIHSHNVRLGENLRRGIQDEYQKARRKFGIITSLDEHASGGIRI